MKKQLIGTWLYGNVLIASWVLGGLGFGLMAEDNNIPSAIFMILSVIVFWVIVIKSNIRDKLENQPDDQLRKTIIASMALFLTISFILSLFVYTMPDDPTIRGDLYQWDQIVAYGSLSLSLFFAVLNNYHWRQINK